MSVTHQKEGPTDTCPAGERRFMNLTQMLHRMARARPDAVATSFLSRTTNWANLKERVARLAAGLRRLGLSEGDRVAILALNSDRFTEYYFAVWWAGGVVTPLNTRWSVNENAYSLNDSDARILFVDDAYTNIAADLRDGARSLETLIYIGEGDCPDGMIDYEPLIANAEPADDALRCEDDLAGLFYTGGTTGFPKGVMLGHRGLWFNALLLAQYASLGRQTVLLHAAPMFHLADGCAALGATMAGGRHVYVPSFDPEGVLDLIETQRVTHALLVPTMISLVLQSPAFSPQRLQCLETIIYGASAMPRGLLRALMERLPHVQLIQAYGQTEMSPIVSILDARDHVLAQDGAQADKLASAGKVALGCEAKIVDKDGVEVGVGEVGEIVARSPGSMLGYWKQPEQTRATLSQGWVRTGDGGYFDADGYLHIVDRIKDVIITGGENVFSTEVESAISTFPGIAAVAVIGIPSEKWGEAVHAIVIPQPDAAPTEAEIIEHCRKHIANYKLPRSIEFRIKPFPLSGSGKVLKRELREPFWKSKERSVN